MPDEDAAAIREYEADIICLGKNPKEASKLVKEVTKNLL